jgi:plastocyanin
MKLRSLLLVLLLAVLSHNALAGGDASQLVIIKDFKFIPQEITIKKGQVLRWENREKRQYHSVWFEALDEEEPADYLFPEDFYEREFNQAGSFPYRCGPHPEMTGIVRVTE